MSESVRNLIDAIATGSAVGTEEHFNAAMAEKISVKLDAMRQDVAANMFASEEVVAEDSLNEVTQGVEHSEWTDNVRDAHPGVKIIKKRTEDGRHIKSQAILNGQQVGQYNMNTGVGTFKAGEKIAQK